MTDEELIRRVAEEVMGWKLRDEYYYLPGETDFYKPIYYVGEFDPLTNLNHAFMVVERMRELEYWSRIYIAICMAALKAVRHG